MKKCKDCKSRYGDTIFLYLSDEQWKNIGCKPKDYLCSNCIMDRVNEVYGLTVGYFVIGEKRHYCSVTRTNIEVKYDK